MPLVTYTAAGLAGKLVRLRLYSRCLAPAAILLNISIFLMSCAQVQPALPSDLLGIQVGMPRAEAERRLGEMGQLQRDERRRQQVWTLNNSGSYSNIAIGYDPNGEVRYMTAFGDSSRPRIRYAEVADINSAKIEITDPHHRYTWSHPSGFKIIAYGTEPEFLSSLSISKEPIESGPASGPPPQQ